MNVIQEAKAYLKSLVDVIERINLDELETLYSLLLESYEAERQIFIFGNGGSAATASHFAVDLNKGVSLGLDKRFKVICLNDNIPTLLAYANDLSYNDIFVEQLKNFLKTGDLVIGISGSGNSENVIRAIEYANSMQAITVAITGFDGGRLKKLAQYSLLVKINDMQITEDVHVIISHLLMRLLYKNLKEEL